MPKKIPETKKIVFTPHEKKKSMLISAGTSVSSAAVAAIAAQILHATGIINGDKFQQTALFLPEMISFLKQISIMNRHQLYAVPAFLSKNNARHQERIKQPKLA